MKQLTKRSTTVMAICFIMISISAFANSGNDKLPVRKMIATLSATDMQVDLTWVPGTEMLSLIVDNPAGKKLSVTLRDASGLTLLRSFLSKDQKRLEKNYLFTDAEEGNYTIDVCDGKKTVSKKITLRRVMKTETVLSID